MTNQGANRHSLADLPDDALREVFRRLVEPVTDANGTAKFQIKPNASDDATLLTGNDREELFQQYKKFVQSPLEE